MPHHKSNAKSAWGSRWMTRGTRHVIRWCHQSSVTAIRRVSYRSSENLEKTIFPKNFERNSGKYSLESSRQDISIHTKISTKKQVLRSSQKSIYVRFSSNKNTFSFPKNMSTKTTINGSDNTVKTAQQKETHLLIA